MAFTGVTNAHGPQPTTCRSPVTSMLLPYLIPTYHLIQQSVNLLKYPATRLYLSMCWFFIKQKHFSHFRRRLFEQTLQISCLFVSLLACGALTLLLSVLQISPNKNRTMLKSPNVVTDSVTRLAIFKFVAIHFIASRYLRTYLPTIPSL